MWFSYSVLLTINNNFLNYWFVLTTIFGIWWNFYGCTKTFFSKYSVHTTGTAPVSLRWNLTLLSNQQIQSEVTVNVLSADAVRVCWSPGSTRGILQQKEGLCWKEWQHGGRMLLQSLCELLTPSHQPLRALRPNYRLIGFRVLVLWPAHDHHGLHIHPLQEREPEGKSLNQASVLKHGAVHLQEEGTVADKEGKTTSGDLTRGARLWRRKLMTSSVHMQYSTFRVCRGFRPMCPLFFRFSCWNGLQ